MSYSMAMEAAGAVVHSYEEFGDYQGTWYAYVTYQGQNGYVHGSYGSCSGCDSFLSEFEFEHHSCGGDNYFSPIYSTPREGCGSCADVMDRLKRFGESYLEGNLMTAEEMQKEIDDKKEWDSGEADNMQNWFDGTKF